MNTKKVGELKILDNKDEEYTYYYEDSVKYYVVPHSAKYKIRVKNPYNTKCRCNVAIEIDGDYMGTWVLSDQQKFSFERPALEALRYTFLRTRFAIDAEKANLINILKPGAILSKDLENSLLSTPLNTGINDSNVDNGLIKITYKPEKFQIFIKAIDNKTIVLNISAFDTILDIKKIIFKRERIPVLEQRLLFGSKQLENEQLLSFYNVNNEATLTLLLRLQGGCKTSANRLPKGFKAAEGATILQGASNQTFGDYISFNSDADQAIEEYVCLVADANESREEIMKNADVTTRAYPLRSATVQQI
jgi:hypothetical protein